MVEINIDNEKYPKLLKEIRNAPKKIYVEGNLEILNSNAVTVVGSRNMSIYGKNMTKKLVKQLVQNNIVIISGLAVGIDTVAHNTCIENGGKTIAVIGSGFNKIFPSENIDLYKKIIRNGGCVISEYEPDTVAQKRYFPMRNRILSGLSLGTLVIEATYRSGTSITANFATKQNRKVLCVPNSVGNKNSVGIINLIKKGAKLVTSANDILYELGLSNENYEDEIKLKETRLKILENDILSNLDDNTKLVYMCIKDNSICNLESILNLLKMNISDVNISISILELKGLIKDNGGFNYSVNENMIC